MNNLKILSLISILYLITAGCFAKVLYPVQKVKNTAPYTNPLYKDWTEVPSGIGFLDSKNSWDSLSRVQTKFKIVYSNDSICLLFDTEIADDGKLSYVKGLKRDSKDFFSGDDFELFLIPGKNIRSASLYQFALLPDKAIFDSRKGDASWNANGINIQSLVKGKKWLVTLTLPFSSLKAHFPKPLEQWQFNVCRTWTDASGRQHYSSWGKLKNNGYHSPEYFPKLIFGAKSSKFPGKVSQYERNWIKNSSLDRKSSQGSFPANWRIYPGTEYTEKYKYDKDHFVISTKKGKVISAELERLVEPDKKLRLEFNPGGESSCEVQLNYLNSDGQSIKKKIMCVSKGSVQKASFLSEVPEQSVVLKKIDFINCSDTRLTLDNICLFPEPEREEFIVGQAPEPPEMVGAELSYLGGFQWGAPPQDKLRILYVTAAENYIIPRIIEDLSWRLGMDWDLIQGLGAEDPMGISDRVKAGKYAAIFYQGDFFRNAPQALKKLVENGLGIVILKSYSSGYGYGRLIFKRGEKQPSSALFRNIPLEEISPSSPKLKFFGMNTIHSGKLGRGNVIEIECAARQFYRHGLLPAVDELFLSEAGIDIDNELNFDWWNYYYSLYGQCLRQAAGYDPGVKIDFNNDMIFKPGDTLELKPLLETAQKVKISAVLFRDSNEIRKYRKQVISQKQSLKYILPENLLGGRYFLNWRLLNAKGKVLNWGTRSFKVIPAHGPAISSLKVPDMAADPEKSIKCALYLKGNSKGKTTLNWFIRDAGDRLIAQGFSGLSVNGNGKADFIVSVNPLMLLSPYGRLSVTLYHNGKPTDRTAQDIYFKLSNKDKLNDYVLAAYTWVPLHYRPLVFKLLRKIGVNTINCWPNGSFKALKEGFQWLDAWGGLMAHKTEILGAIHERHGKVVKPEDKHLQDFSINNPALEKYLRDNVDKYCYAVRHNAPLGYFLCDEMTLAAPWAGLALAEPSRDKYSFEAYRNYLKNKYKEILVLNKQWGTQWKDFASIVPPLTAQARKRDNFSSWVEFRLFMDSCFSKAGKIHAEEAVKHISGIRSGQPNFCYEGPFTGIDPYKLAVSRTGALSYGMDEFNRSFENKGTNIWNWSCYKYYSWQEMRGSFWYRLFHGSSGASIFGIWFRDENSPYGFLHPRLGLTERALTLQKAFTELVSGPGRLIINTPRVKPETVFLFSQSSMHMSWLESGDQISFSHTLRKKPDADSYVSFFRSREGFETLIQDMFMQYDYRIGPQLQKGALNGRKLLVMPMCIGIASETAVEIEKWQRNGGIVLADVRAFARDQLGKKLDSGYLENIFGIKRNSLPSYKPQKISILDYGEATVQAGGNISPVKGTQVLARFSDGNPAVIVHSNRKGAGIYLNFVASYSIPVRNMLAKLLTDRGIKRPVKLFSRNKEAHGYEIFRFKRPGDRSEFIGIYRSGKQASDGKLTLELPGKFHVFDVFKNKYSGFKSKAVLQLPAKCAILLALDSVMPSGIEISIPAKVKRGSIARVNAKIIGKGKSGYRVFRMELFSNSKKLLSQYSRNIDVLDGKWNGIVPVAFNAECGVYQLQFTDAVSGIKKTAAFEVIE